MCWLNSFQFRIIFKLPKSVKNANILTQVKVSRSPVAVKFGVQFFVFAIHFNSFRVEVNSVAEIFLHEVFIAIILEHFCYC